MSKLLNLTQNTAALVAAKAAMGPALAHCLEALKDTSIPLDDRWDTFEELVNNNLFVKNESYGNGFVDSPYDDLYMERGSTKDYVEAYSQLMDRMSISDEELDEWREKVLQSGYSSFTYDW